MRKPHSLLTAALAIGIALLFACSNNASTELAPATQTPIPRATQTLPSGPPPRLNPSGSGPGVLENPERFGVYNTNSRWLFKSGGQIRSRPTISDGTVYVGSDGDLGTPGLYAISIGTGEELWVFPTENGVQSSPALADGVLYFGSRDKNFYALEERTGEEVWRFETGGWVDTDPVIAGTTAIFGSRDGNVYALDIKTGAEIWRFSAGDKIVSSPAVAGELVYIGSNDANMYALDIATGREVWRFTTGRRVESSPLVVDGLVYFGSFDRYLYALDAVSGAVAWQYDAEARMVSLNYQAGLADIGVVPEVGHHPVGDHADTGGVDQLLPFRSRLAGHDFRQRFRQRVVATVVQPRKIRKRFEPLPSLVAGTVKVHPSVGGFIEA